MPLDEHAWLLVLLVPGFVSLGRPGHSVSILLLLYRTGFLLPSWQGPWEGLSGRTALRSGNSFSCLLYKSKHQEKGNLKLNRAVIHTEHKNMATQEHCETLSLPKD